MSGPTSETVVAVSLGTRSYDVHVGSGSIDGTGRAVAALAPSGPVVVVTNPTVAALYLDRVKASLADVGGLAVTVAEIPDGERFKNLLAVESIYDLALSAGADRGSLIVALGGGVVGDVAGFAAATLLRGLRLVMIPTTLLAQVDSSVGGKTGVNRSQGKNLVGAFHQPSLVISDVDTLRTLPDREFAAGLAEVVKYGVILDGSLFELLEGSTQKVIARDAGLLTEIVARCVRLKAQVVEQDETEAGLRRILNFGHTVGHALEQVTEYQRYLHGEAVAIGMVAAAAISEQVGACDRTVRTRLVDLLRSFGLATELPDEIDRVALERAIALDKKVQAERVAFIVAESIGTCSERKLAPAQLRVSLERGS